MIKMHYIYNYKLKNINNLTKIMSPNINKSIKLIKNFKVSPKKKKAK